MNYDDEYEDDRLSWLRIGAVLAAVVLVGAVGWSAFRIFGNPLSDDAIVTNPDSTSPSGPEPTADGSASDQADSTTPTTGGARTVPSTHAPATTSTTSIPTPSIVTTTGAASLGPVPTTTSLVVGRPPSTLPDGSVAPVVAIFDVDTITLAGVVPSPEAAELLATLAVANSKTPASVINLLRIDPAVPAGVGVRIVELTSARFPAGSADVVGDHAAELDRLASVLNAFPNTSVLVIGHADQVGADDNNQQLSEERAAAVVNYLERAGIDAARLSSRAVGESDLISVDNDEASLALNRRTEFIIYGLLVDV